MVTILIVCLIICVILGICIAGYAIGVDEANEELIKENKKLNESIQGYEKHLDNVYMEERIKMIIDERLKEKNE